MHPPQSSPGQSLSGKTQHNDSRLLPATICAVAMLALLQGCALPLPEKGIQDTPAWQPPKNAETWPVDASESRLRVLVYRDGPLARFGHDHVIDFKLQGAIHLTTDITTSGFELEVPLQSAIIDAPAARNAEGADFPGTLSENARHETRNNMLGDDLLAAEAFPLVRIESIAIAGSAPRHDITLRIQVRGRVFEYTFPARIIIENDTIRVDSTFELAQTGLGLEQYSALGGGLQVADRFTVKLQLLARSP